MSGSRSAGRTHGFTLIELLGVVVIIAVLLTIATPRYFRSLERSKEAVLLQDLSVMREAIDHYRGDRGAYPETLLQLVEHRYIRAIPVDPFTKSAETWVVVRSEDPEAPGLSDVRSGADGEAPSGMALAAL